MITVDEAIKRISYNKKLWIKQKRINRFDPTEYYWADATPSDTSWASIQGKIEDLIGGLSVGALPILHQKNGADGFIVEFSKLIRVELKTSFVSFHTIWQSVNGALYTGMKNEKDKKSTLKSSHEAKYSVSEDKIISKKMVTFFILLEDKPGTKFPIVIEARRIEAENIYAILLEKMLNQKTESSKKGKIWDIVKARSIGIKYATLEAQSIRADFDGMGYVNWEIYLKATVPVLNRNDEAQYSIDRNNIKTIQFLQSSAGQNSMAFLDWTTQPNNVLQVVGSSQLTKTDSTLQIPTPCTAENV